MAVKLKSPEKSGEKQKKDTRFKPGQSGNPAGKPKGTISITTEIKNKLKEIPQGEKKTWLELYLTSILQKATKEKDVQMIKTIWNYVDGLPKQSVDLTSKGKQILEWKK